MANPHLAPKEKKEVAHVDETKVTSNALATASTAVADPRIAPASPLPWRIAPQDHDPMSVDIVTDAMPGPHVVTAVARAWGGLGFSDAGEPSMHKNARFVVTAVNAHADLLAALKAIVAGDPHEWLLDRALREQAIAVIAKAEGR